MQLQLKTVYGTHNELAPGVYKRHEEVAQYCRERVKKMGLKLWWDDHQTAFNSPSVTAIRVPENTTWEELDQKLREEGVIFGGRYVTSCFFYCRFARFVCVGRECGAKRR